MTSVYINYPNPHFSLVHGKTVSDRIRHDKAERRLIVLTLESFGSQIARIHRGEIKFAATQEHNDLWLEIDLGDELFELATAQYIQRLIGRQYAPLARAEWRTESSRSL